jgi:hypothetical protein
MAESKDADDLPAGFVRATSGLEHLAGLVELPEAELIAALRQNGPLCEQVLVQSYDKRYQPSTFLEEAGRAFRVGWYDDGYKAVRVFSERELAVADYLLFSFGKGRLRSDR